MEATPAARRISGIFRPSAELPHHTRSSTSHPSALMVVRGRNSAGAQASKSNAPGKARLGRLHAAPCTSRIRDRNSGTHSKAWRQSAYARTSTLGKQVDCSFVLTQRSTVTKGVHLTRHKTPPGREALAASGKPRWTEPPWQLARHGREEVGAPTLGNLALGDDWVESNDGCRAFRAPSKGYWPENQASVRHVGSGSHRPDADERSSPPKPTHPHPAGSSTRITRFAISGRVLAA